MNLKVFFCMAACSVASLLFSMELPVGSWKAVNYKNPSGSGDFFKGVTEMVPQKLSPFLFSGELKIPREKYVFSFQMKSSAGGTGNLFFRGAGGRFNEAERIQFSVRASEYFRSYRLQLPECEPVQFRFDAVYRDGAAVEVKGFTLSNADALPSVAEWNPESFSDVKIKDGVFEAKTRFVSGKIASYLRSPEIRLNPAEKVLCFEMSSDISGRGKLFYRYGNGKYTDANGIFFKVDGNCAFQTYRFRIPEGTDKVTEFRLGPIYADNADVRIRNMRFEEAGNTRTLQSIPSRANFKGRPAIVYLSGDSLSQGASGSGKQTIRPGEKAKISTECGWVNFASDNGGYFAEFDYKTLHDVSLRMRVSPQDAFGQDGKEISIPLKIPASDKGVFKNRITLPPETVSFRISLDSFQGASPLELNSFRMEPEWLPGGKWSPWRSSWIWLPEPKWSSPLAWFRRDFELENKPCSAILQVDADDVVEEIYVNGKKISVGPNAENCFATDLFEVAPLLRSGKNVIAFKARDNGGSRGLLCELAVYHPEKKCFLVLSDSKFKVSDKEENGWADPGFKDSVWDNAAVQTSILQPHRMTYAFLGEKHFLKNCKWSVEYSGKKIKVTLSPSPAEKDLVLEAVLDDGEKYFLGAAPLLSSGESAFVCEFPVPDTLPGGKYTLKLNFPDAIVLSGPMESIVEIRKGNVVRELPECKIVYGNYRVPMVSVNGRRETLIHSWEPESTMSDTIIRNSSSSGVHQYWIGIRFIWKGPGEYDFSAIDKACSQILKLDPGASILLEIPVGTSLYESRSLMAWNKLHPDELVRDEKGNTKLDIFFKTKNGTEVASWASEIWQEEACTIMRKAVEYVKKQSYASNVIGFFPLAGLGHEWEYYGAHSKLYVDYSAPFKKGFRNFLKEKYGTLAELNRKHHAQYASFDAVELPTSAERDMDANHSLIDPAARRKLIDYRHYFSYLTASVIDKLGAAVKKASGGRSLFGTYYGYTVYVDVEWWNEPGHFDLARLLRSPNVDFLVSIVSYSNRTAGGESGQMTAAGSYPIHGKAAVIQSDLRTHRAVGGSFGVLNDVRESCGVVKRELAWTLVTGTTFEYGYYGAGWISGDARLMQLVGKAQNISYELAKTPKAGESRCYDRAAIIVDEESSYHTLQGANLQRLFVKDLMRIIPHSGFGFDVYLASSLPLIADRYKFFVFANGYKMTESQKSFIDQHLKKNGNTLVFQHAPGVTDGERLFPERISEITGIRMKILDKPVNLLAKTEDHPAMKGIVPKRLFGSAKTKITPGFETQEGDVLARFVDSGVPAVTLKRFRDWNSIHVMTPLLDAGFWQAIGRFSGVHIYNTDTSDATMAADNLFAVHTRYAGERTFHVPAGTKEVKELFTDKTYPVADGKFTVHAEEFSTWLFLCM